MAVKFNPSSIGSGLGYATQINQLFSDVQSALQDAVSRTGNGPNAMSADLDLGTNDLLNVGTANLQGLFIEGSRLASLSEMQDLTAEAQNWANLSYNTFVPEGDGVDDYSAKHFATVSSNWAEYGIGSPVPEGNGSEYSARHWADKSNKWAEAAEDAEVETGEYSALHWSKKSEGHAATSLSHANDSQAYRDKAQEWAENPEDDEVEAGKYSAFHWSEKAKENSARAVAAQQASGTNTLTADFGLTNYISTDVFTIQLQNTNTGAVTLNLDSLGPKDVVLPSGNPLPSGSLKAWQIYSLWYDGTDFIVQDPSVSKAVAEAGTQNEGVMTPLRTQEWYKANLVDPSPATDFVYIGGGEYISQGTSVSDAILTVNGSTESVGPTGSGADIIWTALDGIPSDAKSVIVAGDISLGAIASGSVSGILRAGQLNDINSHQYVCRVFIDGLGAGEAVSSGVGQSYIPLASGKIFYAIDTTNSNTENETFRLRLAGYRV